MQVIFYNVPDSRITNFEKMPFAEGVKLSQEVEKACREENTQFSSEYQVLDSKGTAYYQGIFNFGSYEYGNIYQSIVSKSNSIKVKKEHQADKQYLLEQIELLTPEEFKQEEKIDRTLVNLDKSKISKLKSWQRKTIYAVGGLSLFGLLITGVSFASQQVAYENALDDGRNQLARSEKMNEIYESTILQENDDLVAELSKVKNLNENQIKILVNEHVKNDEFEQAVALLDGDHVQVETLILDSNITTEEKTEKIKNFNEVFPSNEARYDLAYLNEEYELMLNIPNITMNTKRSEMKTYALIKLGKIDEAKVELNNNSSEKLAEKITQYEVLTAEINTLKDQYSLLSKDKKDKKKVQEAKKVKSQLDAKNSELKKL